MCLKASSPLGSVRGKWKGKIASKCPPSPVHGLVSLCTDCALPAADCVALGRTEPTAASLAITGYFYNLLSLCKGCCISLDKRQTDVDVWTSQLLCMCLISFYLCCLGERKIMDLAYLNGNVGPRLLVQLHPKSACHGKAQPLTCLHEIIRCPQVGQSVCLMPSTKPGLGKGSWSDGGRRGVSACHSWFGPKHCILMSRDTYQKSEGFGRYGDRVGWLHSRD